MIEATKPDGNMISDNVSRYKFAIKGLAKTRLCNTGNVACRAGYVQP